MRLAPGYFSRRFELAPRPKFRIIPPPASSGPTLGGGVSADGVRVCTTARLHLGFLDLAGDLGRKFGSIGLAIDGFATEVRMRRAAQFASRGVESERAAQLVR